jgi:hypothetical protein
MASLFPNLPAAVGSEMEYRTGQEQMLQEALRSRLMNLENERAAHLLQQQQLDVPLLDLRRQAAMGEQQGIIQRQPFETSRATDLARGAAAPGRIESDIRTGDLESQRKVRTEELSKQGDEMDLFIRAFQPVLNKTDIGDFRGGEEAWTLAFDMLERNKIPGVEQWKGMPREQLLPVIKQMYQQAVDTAPIIRARIKDERDHQQALELQKLVNAGREAAAKAARDADGPKTPNAVIARAMEKYRNNPASVNTEEQGLVREYIETNFARYDEENNGRLWNQAGAMVARSDEQAGRDRKGRAERIRKQYEILRGNYLQQNHPSLYKREITFDQLPKANK